MTLRGHVQSQLREANQQQVLAVLRTGAATQAALARATGLSGATVSTIARGLLDAGAVEAAEDHGGRGQLLRLAPRSGVTAGLAFGASGVLVAVADLTATVQAQRDVRLPAALDAEQALDTALDVLDALLREQGVDRGTLAAVGVALPVPLPGGRSPAHSRWAGHDLLSRLRALLPCPVHVDNDANLGARAEQQWGELRDVQTGAWVKASTGIGLGLVVGGRVHRGAKGVAGELGHVSTDPSGALCACGNRGCLELSAGGPALLREHERATGAALSLPDLVAAAVSGDAVARRLVEDAGDRIGAALAGLVTLLDPERIVLAGHLAAAGDLLVDPLVAALRRGSMPAVAADVAVRVSPLGDDAVALGALALALEHASPRVPA